MQCVPCQHNAKYSRAILSEQLHCPRQCHSGDLGQMAYTKEILDNIIHNLSFKLNGCNSAMTRFDSVCTILCNRFQIQNLGFSTVGSMLGFPQLFYCSPCGQLFLLPLVQHFYIPCRRANCFILRRAANRFFCRWCNNFIFLAVTPIVLFFAVRTNISFAVGATVLYPLTPCRLFLFLPWVQLFLLPLFQL